MGRSGNRPVITLEQVDKELADWQTRLTAASSTLLELDDLFTYKRLKAMDGSGAHNRLTGLTQARVAPALTSIDELWRYLQLLNNAITRATELRKGVPRFWTPESHLTEIDQILHGPSIKLPTITTPLAHRGLLSNAEKIETTTPDQLLTAMTDVFDTAKAAILEVDEAWKHLDPLLDSAQTEVAALQRIAEGLGDGSFAEMDNVRRTLDRLRMLVESDPLGVHTDITTEITPLLQQISARLQELQQGCAQTQSDLQRSRKFLGELINLRDRCEKAQQECRQQVQLDRGLQTPAPASSIDDLGQWLDTLQANLGQGNWKSVRIGLQRWLKAAQDLLAQTQAGYSDASSLLESRAELRGRLAALKAKAMACAARGIPLDASLTAIAAEAEQLLQAQPTPIAAAQQRVSDYESRLNRCLSASRPI